MLQYVGGASSGAENGGVSTIMEEVSLRTGMLLLAMPSLRHVDAFRESVVLLCHHDEGGSMGLIVNRPGTLTVDDVLDELGLLKQAKAYHENRQGGDTLPCVFHGGPIDTFRGFVLHDNSEIYDSTMQITGELYLTASRDILEAIAAGAAPESYRLLLGYAGWEAGQLEQELAAGDWLLAPSSAALLFQVPAAQCWATGALQLGITPGSLSMQSGRA